jgi:hypothetical protein
VPDTGPSQNSVHVPEPSVIAAGQIESPSRYVI